MNERDSLDAELYMLSEEEYINLKCLDMSKWTTKSGETINISDMSTSHIKNCINTLEKLEDSCDYELLDPFLTGFRQAALIDEKFKTSEKINQFNEELLKRNINLNK